MSASLPPRPSLEWLRKTAKDRLVQMRAVQPDARLADAQLALAREYGFSSWRALKAHVERAAAETLDDARVRAFLEQVGAGNIARVRELIAASPELVNAVGPHPFWGGRPQALHVAIETKRRDLFDFLLDHGADVNGSNDQYDHWSPLMLAIQRERPDMRDALLARGAEVGLVEALMLADDTRVAQLLSAGLPDVKPNGGSILGFARTPFAIDRLIALGVPTDIPDRWGSKPIDALSRLGPVGAPLVQHLIARGVAASPAEYARLNDRAALTRLVDADPSVARQDAVMMAAVDFGHHDLVRWLLERGASANARSGAESRHTALHSAAWNGDLALVKLLIEAGADPRARDEQYDASPEGWAATAIEVTNNPDCAAVVNYLHALMTE